MGYFVKPRSLVLTLADGATITIKEQLTHGETEAMYARYWQGDGVPKVNRRMVRNAKVLAYLLDWSLVEDGAVVPIASTLPYRQRLDTLRALAPDVFEEMYKAIEKHESQRAQEKKLHGGVNVSSVTSTSPGAAGGAMTT